MIFLSLSLEIDRQNNSILTRATFCRLFRLLSIFSFQKVMNLFRLYGSFYFSRITRKAVHWGMPWSISIEPTTACNLSCPECPSGLKKFTRPTGNMSFENFKIIIDRQSKYLIWLILYFQGEPFLNTHFFEFVRYAKKKRIFTTTSTNGHYLSKSLAQKTVESGLDQLIISLDGLDSATYKKYRIGGNFEKVMDGIKNLVEAKKAAKVNHPYLIVQFIVFKSNEHQIKEVKRLKNELDVDKVELKTAQFYDFEQGKDLMTSLNQFSRYAETESGQYKIKNRLKNRCLRMWQGNVVTWDGDVVPCCYDKDAEHRFGNLISTDFQTIKSGEKYKTFRQQILNERAQIDICKNCPE
ncbi:MAG TPA: radical SAM protein [Bacteroidales bacterium]|nr:radical SAM protein [Bacteroidales bacterium]